MVPGSGVLPTRYSLPEAPSPWVSATMNGLLNGYGLRFPYGDHLLFDSQTLPSNLITIELALHSSR